MDTNFIQLPFQKKVTCLLCFFANKNHALKSAFLGDIHPPWAKLLMIGFYHLRWPRFSTGNLKNKHLQWLIAIQIRGKFRTCEAKEWNARNISKSYNIAQLFFCSQWWTWLKWRKDVWFCLFFVFFDVFASQSHTVGHFKGLLFHSVDIPTLLACLRCSSLSKAKTAKGVGVTQSLDQTTGCVLYGPFEGSKQTHYPPKKLTSPLPQFWRWFSF